ncbi:MAG: SufD family Fe-S cluster assembly protein [Bacilli bacterium]|nr:SufD family Fe-S cluster assembly protein [Bacilli bacterium]
MSKIVLENKLDLDFTTLEKEMSFELSENKEAWLYITNLNNDNIVNFELASNAILHLSIFAKEPIKNLKLMANLKENSQIIVYFADFAKESNTGEVSINLNGIGATADWHLASLASDKDNKNISVSVYHNVPQTFAKVDNYGVVKDDSKLVFAGTSHILKGSIKSKTHQNAKIMVFDSNSDAIAKPILKIDENDIEASHAAAVGKISDEHLFYLTSRGLNMEDAKMLITLGYLKPIFNGFDEDKVEYINETMGGRL